MEGMNTERAATSRRNNPDLATIGQVALSDPIINDETTANPVAEDTTTEPLLDATEAEDPVTSLDVPDGQTAEHPELEPRTTAHMEASKLLWERRILVVLKQDLAQGGLVGEQEAASLLYLIDLSAKGPKPLHAVIHGDSSSGKSNLVKSVLQLVPEACKKIVSSLSEHALEYSADDAANQVLFIEELPGAKDVEYTLRILQSEGALRRMAADVTGRGKKVKEPAVRHPVATITTTTQPNLHYENATRVFQVHTDGSEGQTRAVLESLAEQETRSQQESFQEQERQAKWKELYWLLPHQQVLIPFAKVLPQAFAAESPRARRDFSRFIGLIKESAILHQFTRPWIREGEDCLVLATTEDLATAQWIWAALQAKGCQKDEPWHAILQPLRQAGRNGLSANELCTALGKKKGNSSVQRHHKAALKAGCIKVGMGATPRYTWVRDPVGTLGAVTLEMADAATRLWNLSLMAQRLPSMDGLPYPLVLPGFSASSPPPQQILALPQGSTV